MFTRDKWMDIVLLCIIMGFMAITEFLNNVSLKE